MADQQINLTSPSELRREQEQLASLAKQIENISNLPNILKREFLGQQLYQDEDGKSYWVQTSKPAFVRIDFVTEKPIKKKVKMPWKNSDGSFEERETYEENEEAIDEVLSMIKFMGVNAIAPLSINTEDNYLDDLKEFECKLAVLLAQKRKDWGLNKDLLPMIQTKIKTLVADTRSLAVKGEFLKSIGKTVQRVEQHIETEQKKRQGTLNPY